MENTHTLARNLNAYERMRLQARFDDVVDEIYAQVERLDEAITVTLFGRDGWCSTDKQ